MVFFFLLCCASSVGRPSQNPGAYPGRHVGVVFRGHHDCPPVERPCEGRGRETPGRKNRTRPMLWFPFPLLPGADPLGMEGVGHSMAGALGMGGGRGSSPVSSLSCRNWPVLQAPGVGDALRAGAGTARTSARCGIAVRVTGKQPVWTQDAVIFDEPGRRARGPWPSGRRRGPNAEGYRAAGYGIGAALSITALVSAPESKARPQAHRNEHCQPAPVPHANDCIMCLLGRRTSILRQDKGLLGACVPGESREREAMILTPRRQSEAPGCDRKG